MLKSPCLLLVTILLIAVNSLAGEYKSAELKGFHQAVAQEQKNDPSIQFTTGKRYYYGDGVPRDYAQARNWFLQAARQGNGNGQYWLGYMYQYGKGGAQDLTKAQKWYSQAAEQGDQRAQDKLYSMGDEGKRAIAAQERMETIKVWVFLAVLCPLWGLLVCFFIPCSRRRIFAFIGASFAGGFVGFFITFAGNGGAAGSSEMSAIAWVCLLIYLVFYYPALARILFADKGKKRVAP